MIKTNTTGKSSRKIYKLISHIFLTISIISAITAGLCDKLVPDSITLRAGDTAEIYKWISKDAAVACSFDEKADIYTAKGGLTLFDTIPIKETSVSVIRDIELIPGGMPFGVKIYCEGILVVGVGDVNCGSTTVSPAKSAGIIEKDLICAANGIKITSSEELTNIVSNSEGKPIDLLIKRGGKELSISVTPIMSTDDGKYKTGMLIRDSTAGIGTVTYVDKEHCTFAGLGHGICDVDTGELLPLTRGAVLNATISGVIKGKAGAPGELKGYFSSGKIGTLTGNKECGVYGMLSEYPAGMNTVNENSNPVKIALSEEISEGEAEILCTIDEGGVKKYKVNISNIDRSGKNIKNFVVTVTDEELLEKTGGIVQGMSGSPILKDGKLIGAVTHVLVNDPTRGYGIFIENMLKNDI